MYFKKSTYRWLYDHIHSKYYNLLLKFCFLPFRGERKFREKLLEGIEFGSNEKILDMCCGTGGTAFLIAEKTDATCEIIGIDLSKGHINKAKKKNTHSNVLLKEGNVTNTN